MINSLEGCAGEGPKVIAGTNFLAHHKAIIDEALKNILNWLCHYNTLWYIQLMMFPYRFLWFWGGSFPVPSIESNPSNSNCIEGLIQNMGVPFQRRNHSCACASHHMKGLSCSKQMRVRRRASNAAGSGYHFGIAGCPWLFLSFPV